MNIEKINEIQNKVLNLAPNRSGNLLKDCCSELSRLVARWLLKTNPENKYLILKGKKVLDTQESHDLLAIMTKTEVTIIDPTVWQFKPKAQTIFVAKATDIDKALQKIKSIYGGSWEISEEITSVSEAEKNKYLDIISKNICENK